MKNVLGLEIHAEHRPLLTAKSEVHNWFNHLMQQIIPKNKAMYQNILLSYVTKHKYSVQQNLQWKIAPSKHFLRNSGSGFLLKKMHGLKTAELVFKIKTMSLQ